MKIYLGTDHAGFLLKEKIKQWLGEWGYAYEDFGAHELNEQDDYPDFVAPVAKAVSEDPGNRRGIILGASGEGEAMVANRFPGVRATVYYGAYFDIIVLSREHNDANILSLGARFLEDEEAQRAVKSWLERPFPNEERHRRRIEKFDLLP